MKEPGLKEAYIDYSSKIGMRDQMAITQFSRCDQDGGLVDLPPKLDQVKC